MTGFGRLLSDEEENLPTLKDCNSCADLREHSHSNEEIWHVIDGELQVTIGGKVHIAGPGMVAMVPPNTLHSVKVLSAGRVIIVDHPRRGIVLRAKQYIGNGNGLGSKAIGYDDSWRPALAF